MKGRRRTGKFKKLRSAVGALEFRRTPFDIPIFLFLVTILISTWTAYSIRLANFKFWVLISAILLYYLITAVSRRYAWWLTMAAALTAAALVLFFVSAGVWHVGISLLGRFIRQLYIVLAMRPFWPIFSPHPNIISGLLAMFFPFIIAGGLLAYQQERRHYLWLTAGCGLITLLGLLVTRSVGAIFALAAGLGVWFLWEISRWLAPRFQITRALVYGVLLVLTAGAGLIVAIMAINLVASIRESIGQRLELIGGSWRLVQDFSFNGSGLATFPALYSEYIQIVPNLFVSYGNFYLDALLELGVAGLITLLWIWLLTGWHLIKALRRNVARPFPERGRLYFIRWATLASWIVVLLQGLTDDILFGGLATPFLFFVPAVAVVVTRRRLVTRRAVSHSSSTRRVWASLALIVLISIAAGVSLREKLIADWLSNQAALEMDHTLLLGWPTNEWRNGRYVTGLGSAIEQFDIALAYDNTNRTAHQRMGMIALSTYQFEAAIYHLEQAHQQDPSHRGVIKSLGYAYLWQGDAAAAQSMLANIPEAEREIREYTAWWNQVQRPDLAEKAARFLQTYENLH